MNAKAHADSSAAFEIILLQSFIAVIAGIAAAGGEPREANRELLLRFDLDRRGVYSRLAMRLPVELNS